MQSLLLSSIQYQQFNNQKLRIDNIPTKMYTECVYVIHNLLLLINKSECVSVCVCVCVSVCMYKINSLTP
jgi:hypothetical protein